MRSADQNDLDLSQIELKRRIIAMTLLGADASMVCHLEWAHPTPSEVRAILNKYGVLWEQGKPGKKDHCFRFAIPHEVKTWLQLPDDLPSESARVEMHHHKAGFDQAALLRCRQIAGEYWRHEMLPHFVDTGTKMPEYEWRGRLIAKIAL